MSGRTYSDDWFVDEEFALPRDFSGAFRLVVDLSRLENTLGSSGMSRRPLDD